MADDIAPYGNVRISSFYDEISPTGEVFGLRSDNCGDYLSKDCFSFCIKF